MTDLVQKLVALISEAPHYFAPQHDFDGKKAEWFNAQRAALSEAKAGGWQPIETAPKDGRDLILLLTPSGFPQVTYSNTWWQSGFSVECRPTGWMPLPAPPAQRGEG